MWLVVVTGNDVTADSDTVNSPRYSYEKLVHSDPDIVRRTSTLVYALRGTFCGRR